MGIHNPTDNFSQFIEFSDADKVIKIGYSNDSTAATILLGGSTINGGTKLRLVGYEAPVEVESNNSTISLHILAGVELKLEGNNATLNGKNIATEDLVPTVVRLV